MSTSWFWSSVSKAPKVVEAPAVHQAHGKDSSAPDQNGIVTHMTFEEVLRMVSPEIAEHYDPNEPRKALAEAIEDADSQTYTAGQLANMASEAGSDSELAREAAAAAAAASAMQANVLRLAAALEDPTVPSAPSWAPNPVSWTPGHALSPNPSGYQPLPAAPAAPDVTTSTWNLPKPSYHAGYEEAREEPQPSPAPNQSWSPDAPPYAVVGMREDGEARYPPLGSSEEAEESLPVHHGGRGHSRSGGPSLQPLNQGMQEFARWRRSIGWGETLAGCSTVDDTRLASLDVFRGLTIAGLIVVVDSGAHFPVLGYSPWAGGPTLGDLTDPFLLFSVGVGIALAFKRVPSKRKALYTILKRTLKLFIIGLLVQGCYFHGPSSLDFGVSLGAVRYWGILQRVAVGFFLVSVCEVAVMKLTRGPSQGCFDLIATFMLHWGVAVLIALTSLALTYFLYVPNWTFTPPSSAPGPHIMLHTETLIVPTPIPLSQPASLPAYTPLTPPASVTVQVSCGVAGDMGPACNAAGYIDRLLFGLPHLDQLPAYRLSSNCTQPDAPSWCQAPFEAWGLLTTFTSILSVFAGLHFGHILTHFKQHWVRLSHASVYSATLLAAGYALQFPLTAELNKIWPDFPDWMVLDYGGMPFNRQLYSFSFLLFTAGLAGLVLCFIYIIADIMNVRFYTKLFEWMGKNALLVFVLGACGVLEAIVRGLYWESPDQNLVVLMQTWLYGLIQNVDYANLVGVLLKIMGWAFLAALFDYNGYSWKF